MELVIVTGMSGAGKSIAANALEDIGFYCIDNMPPSLIKPVVELSRRGQDGLNKVAIVTDIRTGKMFDDLIPTLDEITNAGIEYKLLFLDAENQKLVTRYKETRRLHPMVVGSRMSMLEAVENERKMLAPLKLRADYIIDTTITSTSAFKERITTLFLGNLSRGMTVQCMSFGFKYGLPMDADLVFDVRFMPNPFYIEELRHKTGLDAPVADYVFSFPQTGNFVKRLEELLDFTLPMYAEEGKTNLVIGIGCTGGHHRSVAVTHVLAEHIRQQGYHVTEAHRDISRT